MYQMCVKNLTVSPVRVHRSGIRMVVLLEPLRCSGCFSCKQYNSCETVQSGFYLGMIQAFLGEGVNIFQGICHTVQQSAWILLGLTWFEILSLLVMPQNGPKNPVLSYCVVEKLPEIT